MKFHGMSSIDLTVTRKTAIINMVKGESGKLSTISEYASSYIGSIRYISRKIH